MKLGSLDVDSPYLLAPMAGYTDKPFRSICKTFGAGLTVSELISVNAVYYGNKKTMKLIEKSDIEKPFSIQLFGGNPDTFLYAAQKIEHICDCININAGCPANKVVKAHSGSYLLKEKNRLFEIVDKLKKHIKKPVSIKLRKGFDENSINTMDFYKELEKRGIDFIVIHPRLRSQFFKGHLDYEHIAIAKDALNIDVIVNGGLNSYKKIEEVKQLTRCNFFMIGQSAIDKPYIFEDLINKKDSIRSVDFLKELIKKHFTLMIEYYGEYLAVRNFRKFFHHYTKGIKFSKQLNTQINSAKTEKEVIEIIESINNTQ